jgi:hypothetical protein
MGGPMGIPVGLVRPSITLELFYAPMLLEKAIVAGCLMHARNDN